MEIAKDGWTLRLVRRPNGRRAVDRRLPGRSSAALAAAARRHAGNPAADATVCAPLLRHRLPQSRRPSEPAFVQVGQAVEAGATLCVIEAMKVFNEVRAERDGTVEAVLVASGDEVEAGQPLMRID